MTAAAPTRSPAVVLSAQAPLRRPVWRAAAGAGIMALGLGLAVIVGGPLARGPLGLEPGGLGERLFTAAIVSAVVIPGIVLLRMRWDRRSLSAIGVAGAGDAARGFLLGAGVVAGCGAVALAIATAFGAAEWRQIDIATVLLFLATNTIVALLYEAIPEELSLRGYSLAALRTRFGRGVSALGATLLFLAVPATVITLDSAIAALLGRDDRPFTLAPGGDDPTVYYGMLIGFSILLIFARESRLRASISTCIGAHLAFLTVNRVLLGAGQTGVDLRIGEDAFALVFVAYLAASIGIFVFLRARVDTRAAARASVTAAA